MSWGEGRALDDYPLKDIKKAGPAQCCPALLPLASRASAGCSQISRSAPCVVVFSASLAITGPLYLAPFRGSVLLCQGLGVSRPGKEHPEKWPDKHLRAEKGFQEDGWDCSVHLILSSARLASCRGWIAVFPVRTL